MGGAIVGGAVKGAVEGTGEVGLLGVVDSVDERRNPEFSSITLFN